MKRAPHMQAPSSAPESRGVLGYMGSLIKSGRSRIVLVVAYFSLSLMAACGDGKSPNHPDGNDGGGVTDGDTDTGEGDGGDAEADGGENPCPPYKLEDFQAAVLVKKGEPFTLKINDPKSPFNGATLTGPAVDEDTMIAITPAFGVNVPLPDGKSFIRGQTAGLELLALDPNDTTVPDTCAPKEKAISPCKNEGCKLSLPGTYATVLYFDQDAKKWVEPGTDHTSALAKEGSLISTNAVTHHFSPFYFPNENPTIDAATTVLADGRVQIDLAGTKANNTSEDFAFSAFIFRDGETEIAMERVGNTGLIFKSVNPLSAGRHTITAEVRGLNYAVLPEDKAEKAMDVNIGQPDLCKDKNCDDGNVCNGTETCNPANGECVAGEALNCDDGVFCNGAETCNPAEGCKPPANKPCTDAQICDEGNDVCVGCVKDEDCSQADYCAPQTCDNNICTPEARDCGEGVCDEVRNRCAECVTNADCPSDGNACNGTERCNTEAGTCESVNPVNIQDDGLACNGTEICNPANGQLVHENPVSCGANASCKEPAGSCECDTGYSKNAQQECVDTDGCAENPCNPGYTCNDVPAPGTGRTCDDVNECQTVPGPCGTGYDCQNTPGSYQCNDINECAANPCAGNETCTNNAGGYECKDITAPPAPVLADTSNVMLDLDDTVANKHVSFSADTAKLRVYFTPAGGGPRVLSQTFTVGGGITEMDLNIDVSPDQGYDANGTYDIVAVDAAGNESANGASDSFEVGYKAPAVGTPTINCESTGGYCVAGGATYPVTFTGINAISCTASAQRISGMGTPGTTSSVTLNGNTGSFNYTTGSWTGDIIRITVQCTGPGGNKSEYIDITLE